MRCSEWGTDHLLIVSSLNPEKDNGQWKKRKEVGEIRGTIKQLQ